MASKDLFVLYLQMYVSENHVSQYQAIHAREFTDLTTKYAQLLTAMWLHHHWTEHMHIFSNLVIRRAWRCGSE